MVLDCKQEQEQEQEQERKKQVSMDKIASSVELCGGSHVQRTGDIGPIEILSEEASASGVRRLTVVMGEKALELHAHQRKEQQNLWKKMDVSSHREVMHKIESLKTGYHQTKERLQTLLIEQIRLDLQKVEPEKNRESFFHLQGV